MLIKGVAARCGSSAESQSVCERSSLFEYRPMLGLLSRHYKPSNRRMAQRSDSVVVLAVRTTAPEMTLRTSSKPC